MKNPVLSDSLKCDLLWSASWILLHVSSSSMCTPLQEQGKWSGVPNVAKKAILHSESAPRIRAGSIRLKQSSSLRSPSLHCVSLELQHLVWNVFKMSLVKKEKHSWCLLTYWFALCIGRENTHCIFFTLSILSYTIISIINCSRDYECVTRLLFLCYIIACGSSSSIWSKLHHENAYSVSVCDQTTWELPKHEAKAFQ